MKNIHLLLLLFISGGTCLGQGVFSNQTNNALEKVVQDYPSQFKNIKGELLAAGPVAAEYKSTVTIPGALSTTITQSANKQTVSWQSVVYAGKEFTAAKKRFEELFNQIKNTIIKPQGEKAAIVNGLYVDPSADNTFTTIQFDLMPAAGIMQKINIDLMIKNIGGQWKIMLSVYDKDMKEMEGLTVK